MPVSTCGQRPVKYSANFVADSKISFCSGVICGVPQNFPYCLIYFIKSSIEMSSALATFAIISTDGFLITLLSIFVRVVYLTPDFWQNPLGIIPAYFGTFLYSRLCLFLLPYYH